MKTDDVARVFQEIAARCKVAANRWLASVRACLQAAWRRELVPANAAMPVKALPEPQPRARVLSGAEHAAVVAAVHELTNPHTRAALLLLLATGSRRSEVLHARWADFDLDAATWRIPSTKSGRPQTLPLAAGVVAMLREVPRLGSLVVPGGGADIENPRSDLKKGG